MVVSFRYKLLSTLQKSLNCAALAVTTCESVSNTILVVPLTTRTGFTRLVMEPTGIVGIFLFPDRKMVTVTVVALNGLPALSKKLIPLFPSFPLAASIAQIFLFVYGPL